MGPETHINPAPEKQDGAEAKDATAMNIGKISQNSQGNLQGEIHTLKLSLAFILVNVNSPKERAPKYEIQARAPNGSMVTVGALWEQSARSSGECFLQGRVDDITLSAPIQIAAFRQDDGSYNVVWQAPRRNANMTSFSNTAANADNEMMAAA